MPLGREMPDSSWHAAVQDRNLYSQPLKMQKNVITHFKHRGCYRVILAQLEGSGRGALAAYNQEQYTTLFSHLQDVPLNDPDQWLEQLMRKDKALGRCTA